MRSIPLHDTVFPAIFPAMTLKMYNYAIDYYVAPLCDRSSIDRRLTAPKIATRPNIDPIVSPNFFGDLYPLLPLPPRSSLLAFVTFRVVTLRIFASDIYVGVSSIDIEIDSKREIRSNRIEDKIPSSAMLTFRFARIDE